MHPLTRRLSSLDRGQARAQGTSRYLTLEKNSLAFITGWFCESSEKDSLRGENDEAEISVQCFNPLQRFWT